MASAQKWGGVQKKMMAKSKIGAQARESVTADHPISTGAAPAAPPMTILLVDLRFSHSV
jgi:hypothetical protein